jgi:hypothetical protein
VKFRSRCVLCWLFGISDNKDQMFSLSFRKKMKMDITGNSDFLSASDPESKRVAAYPIKKDIDGLFFWSLEQEKVLSDPVMPRTIIKGGSGVGKTLLLKTEALEAAKLSSEEKSVLFVVGSIFQQSPDDHQIFFQKTNFNEYDFF